MTTGQAQPTSQQQQKQVRKPPFADWPTIKILIPPQGRFSLANDEWCMTYCSQSVTGRIHGKEPYCRSLCVRKVFPHEVRNVITFKRHKQADQSGKATYPLPTEGQPVNLPRIFGGKPPEDTDNSNYKPQPTPTPKNWDEGLYIWTAKGRMAAHEKIDSMSMDFEQQRRVVEMKERRREVWQDYQESLQKKNDADNEDVRMWVANVPPRPLPDTSPQSLLVPFPPDSQPFWGRIHKLLAPSVHVLGILKDSFKSGEQTQFARRIWEKAQSNEPFTLASRALSHTYELWKEGDDTADEGDDKKDSH